LLAENPTTWSYGRWKGSFRCRLFGALNAD
jgi:hypothetical protein